MSQHKSAQQRQQQQQRRRKKKMDWRARCMEKFGLEEVPESWRGQVPKGSQKAWRAYYQFRTEISSKDDEECYDYKSLFVYKWKHEIKTLQQEAKDDKTSRHLKWMFDLVLGRLDTCRLHGRQEIDKAEFYAWVYSPYAIPHAIDLEHQYYVQSCTGQVSCHWGYKLLDFENFSENYCYAIEEHDMREYNRLCSNSFDNNIDDSIDYLDEIELDENNQHQTSQVIAADSIQIENLNAMTVQRLRRFLLGSVMESKLEYCDDWTFLCLLFASMGTFRRGSTFQTLGNCPLGHTWTVDRCSPRDRKLQKNLIRDGIIPGDGSDDDYPSISWLEHAMRRAASFLRPIDEYYKLAPIPEILDEQQIQEDERPVLGRSTRVENASRRF